MFVLLHPQMDSGIIFLKPMILYDFCSFRPDSRTDCYCFSLGTQTFSKIQPSALTALHPPSGFLRSIPIIASYPGTRTTLWVEKCRDCKIYAHETEGRQNMCENSGTAFDRRGHTANMTSIADRSETETKPQQPSPTTPAQNAKNPNT